MNETEEKRLRDFQEDGKKGVSTYDTCREKLTYPDLLLLLKEDKMLRKLIRRILKADRDDDETAEPETLEAAAPAAITRYAAKPAASTCQDPLRQQLKPELELLALVRADAEAASLLLSADPGSESEGRQLLRLTASAAQWERLLSLWELLAERCKTGQRPATASERRMLDAGLDIHNLVWRDCQAALQPAEVGSRYDYQRHDRGAQDGKGDTLSAEWLPGLLNAAGKLQKKPLVAT